MRTASLPLLFLLALAAVAPAQEIPEDGPGPGDDRPLRLIGREAMWPAPTAEDWAKPCLITWQRTWDDAVAVAKETGRPILVCINMDGEIASEHYAGVRYRQPEIAALYEPYVCVIASVYRHTPRDHDEQGHRVECPRFGGVTCGEHIALESVIFEKFCDGKRIAPRHICVELDGSETYDVYYANDTASVFEAIRDGIAERPPLPPRVVRGDRPLVERVASRDVRDRTAVEAAYREGDAATRSKLLEAALAQDPDAQLELLRLALFGLDLERSRTARAALTEVDTAEATRLVADALRVPMDAAARDALLATLKRLGELSPLARYLSVVHRGLEAGEGAVDVERWAKGSGGATYPAPAWSRTESLAAHIESKAEASEARPDDPEVRLDLAEASLALALKAPETYSDPRTAYTLARYLYEDAQRVAREAEERGAKGWRVDAVLALAAYYGGDLDTAYERAEAAVRQLPPGHEGWTSMAVVTVFAESRWKAIKAAVREQKEWPARWLGDLHGAYSLLLRHPLGTDGQVAWHYDLLDWLGADYRSERVLRAGLARFQTSAALHQRWREKLLIIEGPDGLEAAYATLLEESEEPTRIAGFAARASVAAAEQLRRDGELREAIAAYGRAVARYQQAGGGHGEAIALARAGRARVALELGDLELAVDDLAAALAKSPDAAATRDGMGITPGETALALLARLRREGRDALAARLEGALASVDPELLRPDEG